MLAQKEYGKKAGDLIFIRGSKRIMLVHPGYQTLCTRAQKLDGENLSITNIQNLFIQLTSAWKKERFQNP